MDPTNSNDLLNLTKGGRAGPETPPVYELEAYTVVLSVTAHALSMLFGGGSSLAVIIAVTSRHNINKYSYTLVLALFLSCCGINFIWSPLEVLDLITYHHFSQHPWGAYLMTKTALYVFPILVLSLIIILLSIEGILRLVNRYGRVLRKLWPMLTCSVALCCALFLTAGYVSICAHAGGASESSFILQDSNIRSTFLALVSFVFILTFLSLVLLGLLLVRDNMYWEDGRPQFRKKPLKLTIPEFLISHSNACADNDGGFEPSGTPSPSTPKLLTVSDPDTLSIKGEDANTISELPSPVAMAKPMGSRLGINMAQVLGRRRHTICQISDATNTTPTDPISRAKQYNYVRKFSVDISALQAQLQNPKIFRDAPFQSDIDLNKKVEASKSGAPKPLLPLRPLKLRNDETGENRAPGEDKTVPVSATLPPPPVIMVSNEDAQSNHGDSEYTNAIHGANETTFHSNISNSVCAGLQKPTTLVLSESCRELEEEHMSVPTLDSGQSAPSEGEPEHQKLAKLSLLTCLTFVLNMLPVFVTEALQASLSRHAFVNISSCTLAVSAIQTIIYPHLVASSDEVIHRAVQRLKARVKSACGYPEPAPCHPEDSSSTSQL